MLVPITALTDGPVRGELFAFYEALFVVCAFAAAIIGGDDPELGDRRAPARA